MFFDRDVQVLLLTSIPSIPFLAILNKAAYTVRCKGVRSNMTSIKYDKDMPVFVLW